MEAEHVAKAEAEAKAHQEGILILLVIHLEHYELTKL